MSRMRLSAGTHESQEGGVRDLDLGSAAHHAAKPSASKTRRSALMAPRGIGERRPLLRTRGL
jgi:hypothetical protein